MLCRKEVFISIGILCSICTSLILFICTHFLQVINYMDNLAEEISFANYFFGVEAALSVLVDVCFYLAIFLLFGSLLLIGYLLISRGYE